MTTTQPDLRLVEILKRLGSKWVMLRDRLDRDPWLPVVATEAADDTASMEDYELYWNALWGVIGWLCERTDVDKWDVWEASHRLGTANGLSPWKKQTGDEAEYRDLRFILPKLHALDRDGSTARLIAERPDIAELVGLPATRTTPKGSPRKRRATLKPKPLTARQAEIVQIVGECNGDIAEAARKLGVTHKTVAEAYKVAMGKIGITAVVRPTTTSIPEDHRGQMNVSEDRRTE